MKKPYIHNAVLFVAITIAVIGGSYAVSKLQKPIVPTTPAVSVTETATPIPSSAETHARSNALRAKDIMKDIQTYENALDFDDAYYKKHNARDADMERIGQTLTDFGWLVDALDKARQEKQVLAPTDIAHAKRAEARLSALQQKLLPSFRLAFKNAAAQLLWAQDTYVAVSGGGNSVITFTGWRFAANANILAAEEASADILQKLRFKEQRYRWIEHATKYTYQKLNTPPDSKLMIYRNGNYQPMAAGYGS